MFTMMPAAVKGSSAPALITARYWRLRMTAKPATSSDQFAGFQGGAGGFFSAAGVSQIAASYTANPAPNFGSAGALGSFDPGDFIAWNVGSGVVVFPTPLDIIADFVGTPVAPKTIKFASGGSPFNSRNPDSFELAYSNDGTTFITTNMYTGVVWGASETKTFTVQ